MKSVDRLAAMIALPSVTGAEGEVIARIDGWLRAIGGDVESHVARMTELERDPEYPGREVEREDVPFVCATLEGARPGPHVVLTGHVDVVPPGDPAAWSADPFEPRVDGDRLFGRGAADMKGGIVSLLAVYEAFAASDFAGTLTFLAVPGEEDGGTGTLAAIRHGLRPDFVIIPEPTAGDDDVPQAVVAHAGAIVYRLTFEGRPAHAAFRREGESALSGFEVVHRALEIAERRINETETDALMRALDLPYPTNVGVVRGGDWASTVMESLVAEIRVGVALGESIEEADARVRETIATAAAEAGGWLAGHPPRVQRSGGVYRSARTPSDDALVAALRGASAEVYGAPASLAAMPYGCDMGQWRHLTGASVVVYGPGRARVAHTIDEWVSLDAVMQTARVLERTVRRLR
ncbi:MAG: ArgE/DapE family deacylase [Deltaproteobacteria bacterium]